MRARRVNRLSRAPPEEETTEAQRVTPELALIETATMQGLIPRALLARKEGRE
jgi:hypothetical protein